MHKKYTGILSAERFLILDYNVKCNIKKKQLMGESIIMVNYE